MKKIIIILSLVLTVLISCKNNNKNKNEKFWTKHEKKELKDSIKAPRGVKNDFYLDYLAYFGPKWSFYKVKSKNALAQFKKYFKDTPYKVIWHWDIDGDGIKDSLAVEVFSKINRGIKRGILVDENGKVKLYIDTIRGVYAPGHKNGSMNMIVDLKRMGVRPGELSCFAIGYISPKMANYKYNRATPAAYSYNVTSVIVLKEKYRKKYDEIYENKKEEIKRRGLADLDFSYSHFYLQRIDKNLNVMRDTGFKNKNVSYISSDEIILKYIPKERKSTFGIPLLGTNIKEHYRDERRFIRIYRKAKREGKVFSPPSKFNKEHIEKALKLELN